MLRRAVRFAPSLRAASTLPAVRLSQAVAVRASSANNLIRPVSIQASFRSFGTDAKSETFLPVSEVAERVMSVVKNFEKVDPSKVKPTSHFVNDLGLDSLDTVELIMAFEEEFVLTIPDDISEKILTCEDAIKFISQHPQAR